MADGLSKITLVAVEVFGTYCDHDAHRGEPEPFGWGLCDAVQAWSDCNRANGHIFRVDDTDPQHRRPEDVITVWVSPDDREKLMQRWGEPDDNPPSASSIVAAAEERGKAAGIREGWAQAAAALRDRRAVDRWAMTPDLDAVQQWFVLSHAADQARQFAADFLDAAAPGGGDVG